MAEGGTLSELRAKQEKGFLFRRRQKKNAPWLFNWKSLFYYLLVRFLPWRRVMDDLFAFHE
jgi:hypothetical protein